MKQLLRALHSILQFIILVIFLLFLVNILTGCASDNTKIKPIPILEKYGEDCFHKPYTNSRDNQSLCMTSAIAKHNAQVDTINNLK